jgi:hypothetical protein
MYISPVCEAKGAVKAATKIKDFFNLSYYAKDASMLAKLIETLKT